MKKIVLIGFAACYKTSVGRLLAHRLNCTFVDVDEEIERSSGLTVQQIFSKHGEESFRQRESAMLAQLATDTFCVVACGGGSVLSSNFKAFASDATVVWLTAMASTVQSRLGETARPLFDKLSESELQTYINNRQPYYTKYANFSVATDGLTPEQVTELIVQLLSNNT